MNDRQAAFVEEMGQYLASIGMTPMSGRMLAWLLICDPAEQTAADLADMPPGEPRRDQRRRPCARDGRLRPALAPPRRPPRVLQRPRRRHRSRWSPARPRSTTGSRVIAAHGIGVVADLPPPKRERIEEFHDFVAFVEHAVPSSCQQYLGPQRDAAQARERHRTRQPP